MTNEQVKEDLKSKGQLGLLRFYDELTENEKATFKEAVEKINWDYEKTLKNPEDLTGAGKKITPIDGLHLSEIEKNYDLYYKTGIAALKEGKVAALLLAGGQGTRLGVDGPKGAYDIGITKPLYIFEQQIKNLLDVVEKCGVYPTLYVMTSEKNNAETINFLKQHNYFAYPEEKVKFFVQDMMPAVDFDGKIYLERKNLPALSPNGNGGWYSSFCKAGYDEDIKKDGVEWINIYAVDNVLQRICDPVFIGATILSKVNCGAKVVCKTVPEEKVGVLCKEDGKPAIIEYYELTKEMANLRNEDGSLAYSFGVILNYLFKVKKLEETAKKHIPMHIVKKKIEYVDEEGNIIKPEKENGLKFETLAVDLVKLMDSVLPFEVEREKEFAPIKNKIGVDSVESARKLLEKNGVVL